MFWLAIKGLADDDQAKEWIDKINHLKMIGCYA
jgi:hypothetical protein